jgi:hypothetical protein
MSLFVPVVIGTVSAGASAYFVRDRAWVWAGGYAVIALLMVAAAAVS